MRWLMPVVGGVCIAIGLSVLFVALLLIVWMGINSRGPE